MAGQHVSCVLDGADRVHERLKGALNLIRGSWGSGRMRPLMSLISTTTLTRSATTEVVVRAAAAGSAAEPA